jgi:hypothetical protein
MAFTKLLKLRVRKGKKVNTRIIQATTIFAKNQLQKVFLSRAECSKYAPGPKPSYFIIDLFGKRRLGSRGRG